MAAAKSARPRSAALAGLVLAAGVAQESTNGVPIVNGVLGAVAHIATLAAKIESDREALHALADKAARLAVRITAVLADRALEGEILESLRGVYDVLLAVQELFEAHIAKTRMRRAISYILSVPKDVERLSADLGDAFQEFLLVAALDTNVRVQANARFIGPARRLHDFEIEKLELVARIKSDDGLCSVRYHSARVEGTARLFVVRSVDGADSGRTDGTTAAGGDELRRRADAHDSILADISTVDRSHPNIAYLYGRGTQGCCRNRFVVLRTGSRPLIDVLPEIALTSTWSMMAKLLDAAHHLTQFGAVWLPDTHRLGQNLFLDDRGEPTIGLIHDLQSAQSVARQEAYQSQVVMLSEVFNWAHRGAHGDSLGWPALGDSQLWPYLQIQHAIAAAGEVDIVYKRIERSELARLVPLSGVALSYLRSAETALARAHPRAESLYWWRTLCALATGGTGQVGSGLYAAYHAASHPDSADRIRLHRVVEDGEHVHHACYDARIPPQTTATVRQALGIMMPEVQAGTTAITFELVHIDGPSARPPASCQWVRRWDD